MKKLKEMVAKWKLNRAKKKSVKTLEAWVKWVQSYRAIDPGKDGQIQDFAQKVSDYMMFAVEKGSNSPDVMAVYKEADRLWPTGEIITKEDAIQDLRDLIELLVELFNDATGMNLEISFEKK